MLPSSSNNPLNKPSSEPKDKLSSGKGMPEFPNLSSKDPPEFNLSNKLGSFNNESKPLLPL